MNPLLKTIGLYDKSNLEINTQRSELVQNLWKITYGTNTSFISLVKDSTIPTRFEYRGIIDENSFTIKKRRHFLDLNIYYPVIKGSMFDKNNITKASVEYIPSFLQMFTFILLLCFFLLAITVNIKNGGQDLAFLAVSSLMTGAQYFNVRRGIIREKQDFEKEMKDITQKYAPTMH